jgi:RimJ/RimL family protein N-acetyltransferase
MKLLPLSEADLPLYIQMFCDPDYMKELGGAVNEEKAGAILLRHITFTKAGTGLVLKMVPDVGEDYTFTSEEEHERIQQGVGSLCIWRCDREEQISSEMGWGVATAYQGRKFASKATKLFLETIITSQKERWGDIYASTGVNNAPSLALCQRLGFQFFSDFEMDFYGKKIPAKQFLLKP